MKIFMLLSRVPWPLEKGDKLRAYHQLRYLATKHEVYLVCLNDRRRQQEALSHLLELTPHVTIIQLNRVVIGWRLFRALFSDKPFQMHYFFQSGAARKVRNLISQFQPDHIYCQLIRSAEYVKNLHQYPKTLDYMDALSAGQHRRIQTASWWMKLFVREESKRLLAYENLIFDYFEHHTIISAQDRQLIFHQDRNKICVVPNGIDAVFFTPKPTDKKYDIAFTGNMSYPPNVDCAIRLAKEILPIIQKKIPNVRLIIAGATPTRAVLQLQNEHVIVTGWLEDIRKVYNESRIFMAPMRTGSGLQNKLLEAMCMNLPCVTSVLAANAMNATHHVHALIGEKNEELADMAIELLTNHDKAQDMAARGKEFATSHFNWEATVNLLLNEMQR